MSACLRAFSKLLGAELKPVADGYTAVLRGKEHFFPSLTHVFDAARHGTGEYQR